MTDHELSKEKAYEAAESTLEETGFNKVPVPVDRIAKKLNIQIRYSPMDDELSGMIHIKEGVAIMGINVLHHPNRQRFTISHEIGHFILHNNVIENSIHVDKQFHGLARDAVASEGTDEIEIQANAFASELLMPKDLLLKEIDSIFGSSVFDIESSDHIEKLSNRFKVSTQAMLLRLSRILA